MNPFFQPDLESAVVLEPIKILGVLLSGLRIHQGAASCSLHGDSYGVLVNRQAVCAPECYGGKVAHANAASFAGFVRRLASYQFFE
jgi:hypothetical protein